MLTNLELRLVHTAYRQIGLEEEHYRLILQNVAGVASAKGLDQNGFEDVMAVLEDSGFRQQGKPEDYWRKRVALRAVLCGPRMAYRINALATQQPYALAGLCRRVSGGRIDVVDQLTPRQAYQLMEMLKAIVEREEDMGGAGAPLPGSGGAPAAADLPGSNGEVAGAAISAAAMCDGAAVL